MSNRKIIKGYVRRLLEPLSSLMIEFDVSCEKSELLDGSPGVNAKLGSEFIEVNVWFTAAEAHQIRLILELEKDAPGLRLGCSAESPVFWAKAAYDHLYLLIGEGDTTWDIGITLPLSTVRSVVEEVEALCNGHSA